MSDNKTRSGESLEAEILKLPAATSHEVSAASDALFEDLHLAALNHRIVRDLAYGVDARHRLDIHLPDRDDRAMPVLLFVHGGGFVKGDKSAPGVFYYDNVGAWAASQGFVGANMTYRLAPEHAWPSGAEDIARAIAWLREHASEYGGDPERIVLMGHSAGAAHAGGYLAGHGGSPIARDAIAGCILVSGTYDLQLPPVNTAYFGEDSTRYAERSPARAFVDLDVPLLLAVAEADPPRVRKQFAHALKAFVDAGRPLPQIAYAPGHNHYTVVLHLNTDDHRFGDQLARFITRRSRVSSDS